MCDYSLQNVKSRPASVGDKLITRNFGTGTRGFAAPEDPTTAVCVLPGTELAFSKEIACISHGLWGGARKARFTRRRSSARSTRIPRTVITMRSSSPTARRFC